MLGKGPTFADRARFDLRQFHLISLNHAVREQAVEVAHFIDLEALAACADVLPRQAEWLLTPLVPHVAMQPGDRRLDEYFTEVPVLGEFARRGRLVWYYHDLVSRPELKQRYPLDAEPIIRVDAFSAEAVVGVLAVLGARTVRTLGIDGGIHYAREFHDLNGVTRLANGQPSFDRQFIQIHRIAKECAMDYGPLTDPIRVYVGTDETQLAAVQVLEYSIRRFATRPIEVVPLLNLPTPQPKDPANRPRTGFSFARFHIPRLAGFRGKAIYLDADMLVFGDIADLWDAPMGASRVLCTRQDTPPITWQNNQHFQPGRQMSVLLIDCERCRWDIEEIVRGLDEGRYSYRQLMADLCIVPPDEIGENLDPMWNCLEHFEAGRTKLLHYTDMDMQPWRHRHNPLGSIWRAYYRAAVEAGAVDPAVVERGIAGGWLLPELGEALRHAPGRCGETSPAAGALAGTPSVRQRSLELECTALRAELGLLRLEAEQLRHQSYVQYLELGKTKQYADQLADQTRAALARSAELEQAAAAEKSERLRAEAAAHASAQQAVEFHREFLRVAAEAANLAEELNRCQAELLDCRRQIECWQQRYGELQESWTWRIGRAVTRPARAVRGLPGRMKRAG